MAQSLAKIICHLVFSTKNRTPFLRDEAIRRELNSYVAATLKELDSPALLIGSLCDHIHILFLLSRTRAVCDILEEIKKNSSKWIKTKSPDLRDFQWQSGYGIFSVSQSNVAAVKTYVAEQEEHHRTMTFQDEFRRLLEKHEVAYDERYVWD
jgi:REP element-mobilizing transposase RayT